MKGVKTIAIYLPQYYKTEYNDKWWGEGFTDWVAVKKATPCFDEHCQPKVPLNNNYYDLTDKSTMMWQASLMKKYRVYGLCFYHYYFKNGTRVLEKPAENLLKWKEIDIPFCFNWASERWIRTWSNFYGNVWGEKFDKDEEPLGNGLLLEQEYGSRREWKTHFEYLLQFFMDDRYIKIDGKPVFIFHNVEQISCIKEMTKYWNELAKKAGLAGIYFIGENTTGYREELDALTIFEPTQTKKKLLTQGQYTVKNGVVCFEYEDFVNEELAVKPFIGMKTFFCGVSGYDTTPRRGTNGECFLNVTEKLFKKLMDGLYRKSFINGNEFVFINAWNEWGEGMYLEPDEKQGYFYLDIIKKVDEKYEQLELLEETVNMDDDYDAVSEIKALNQKVDKFRSLYEITIAMATIIQNQLYSIKDYFECMNIKTVAVYGIGPIGKLLINQLLIEEVNIIYTVDNYAARIQESIPVYKVFEDLPRVDFMIVTAYGSTSIIEELQAKGLEKVVSIETWISDLMSFYTK